MGGYPGDRFFTGNEKGKLSGWKSNLLSDPSRDTRYLSRETLINKISDKAFIVASEMLLCILSVRIIVLQIYKMMKA